MSGFDRAVSAMTWKILERFGLFTSHFIIQIILARLLEPKVYGLLTLMMIFIAISNIIIQNGFNTALIQRQDITEEDYSTVFWFSEIIALTLCVIIWILAPYISNYYGIVEMNYPLKALSLILPLGALNSIQIAKITKELDLKKIFISNTSAVVISGSVGIFIAYNGFGIWALVIQNIINSLTICIVMFRVSDFRIKMYFSFERFKFFFSFGWKLVVSGLLNNISESVRGVIIGIKFDSASLGFYNRGMQFPQYGINIIQGALQSVMLPLLAEQQDNKESFKYITKKSIIFSSFFVFPIMATIGALAPSFVVLLLTEKWIDVVPYIRIFCLVFAFYPVNVINLQAINALGRSDIYLRLEIIKQVLSLIVLTFSLHIFSSPIYMALCSVIFIPIGLYINSYPITKYINYGFLEQVKDIAPFLSISSLLYIYLIILQKIDLPIISNVIFQLLSGMAIYISLFKVFTPNMFKDLEEQFIMICKKYRKVI